MGDYYGFISAITIRTVLLYFPDLPSLFLVKKYSQIVIDSHCNTPLASDTNDRTENSAKLK